MTAQLIEARGLLPMVSRIAAAHHVTVWELIISRHGAPTRARSEVFATLRDSPYRLSYSEIARLFSRDHSTVSKMLAKDAESAPAIVRAVRVSTLVMQREALQELGAVELPTEELSQLTFIKLVIELARARRVLPVKQVG